MGLVPLSEEDRDLALKKKMKRTQINGRIYCAHGLEELIWLK